MDPRSFPDLLSSINERMVSVTSHVRCCDSLFRLPYREYIFQESSYFEKPFVFTMDNGININFMRQLCDLRRQAPIIYTTPHHKKETVHGPSAPIQIYNTGTKPLFVGTRFTVIPPLCNVKEAVRAGDEYVLQTVEYDSFSREINELCQWLICLIDIQKPLEDTRASRAKELWRRLFEAGDQYLGDNSLWQDMITAIKNDTHSSDKSMICRTIGEMCFRYWNPLLVGYDRTCPLSYTKPLITSTELLSDIFKNHAEIEKIDVDKLSMLTDDIVNDDAEQAIYLTSVINTRLELGRNVNSLAKLFHTFSPQVVGVISEAENAMIKPGTKMSVTLIP